MAKAHKKKRKTTKKKQNLPVMVYILGILLALFMFTQAISLLSESVFKTTDEKKVSKISDEEKEKIAFIKKLAPKARSIYQEDKILPSISLAQASLESDFGRSQLAKKAYNLYGVKADASHASVMMKTKEYVNDQWITIDAAFRLYESWSESMEDHANLMKKGTTWNANQYQAVFQATDYQTAAQALKDGGYATDPDYPKKLIALIKEYSLDNYDLVE